MHGFKPKAHRADNGAEGDQCAERSARWADHAGLARKRERRRAHRQRQRRPWRSAPQMCVEQASSARQRDAHGIAGGIGVRGAQRKAERAPSASCGNRGPRRDAPHWAQRDHHHRRGDGEPGGDDDRRIGPEEEAKRRRGRQHAQDQPAQRRRREHNPRERTAVVRFRRWFCVWYPPSASRALTRTYVLGGRVRRRRIDRHDRSRPNAAHRLLRRRSRANGFPQLSKLAARRLQLAPQIDERRDRAGRVNGEEDGEEEPHRRGN